MYQCFLCVSVGNTSSEKDMAGYLILTILARATCTT